MMVTLEPAVELHYDYDHYLPAGSKQWQEEKLKDVTGLFFEPFSDTSIR